jgi:large subunit ribosomal protein L13Ae
MCYNDFVIFYFHSFPHMYIIFFCSHSFSGMLPHKIERGQEALGRIKLFEGVPAPYDAVKRVVVPSALRLTCLKPGRDFTHLGQLCHEIGWKHWDLIKRLEAARKVKSEAWYVQKKEVSFYYMNLARVY